MHLALSFGTHLNENRPCSDLNLVKTNPIWCSPSGPKAALLRQHTAPCQDTEPEHAVPWTWWGASVIRTAFHTLELPLVLSSSGGGRPLIIAAIACCEGYQVHVALCLRDFSHGWCSSLDHFHFLCITLRSWKHLPCFLDKTQHYIVNDLIY